MALSKSVCDNCVNTECLWRAPTGGGDPPVMSCLDKIEKPQTNYDRILSQSPEDLAILLAWPMLVPPPWCADKIDCPYIDKDVPSCDRCALEWLQQEARE